MFHTNPTVMLSFPVPRSSAYPILRRYSESNKRVQANSRPTESARLFSPGLVAGPCLRGPKSRLPIASSGDQGSFNTLSVPTFFFFSYTSVMASSMKRTAIHSCRGAAWNVTNTARTQSHHVPASAFVRPLSSSVRRLTEQPAKGSSLLSVSAV
jgi:hypothetical protein